MPSYVFADGRLNVTGIPLPQTAPNPKKEFSGPAALLAMAGHFRQTGHLFSGPPSRSDVRQAGVGDCFFLATVAAILAQPNGPNRFLDMMRDVGDGTVVVRLYSGSHPQLVRVEKSLLAPGLHNRGALWLQILEKAFASLRGGYGALNDGEAEHAFRAMLGHDAVAIEFKQQGRNPERLMLDRCLTYKIAVPDVTRDQMVNIVFGGDRARWSSWASWLQSNDIPRKWAEFIASKVMVRQEHFDAFMHANAAALDPAARQLVETWVVANQALPGKRGTGVYTAAELRTYAEIQNALAQHKAVTVETPDTFRTIDDTRLRSGAGFSAGEDKYKGLIAKHYYAVVRCETRGNLRGLVIRNPWGESRLGAFSYGKSYEADATTGHLSSKTNSKAEFWLDLSDLSKYFSDVKVGAAAV